MEAQLDLYGDNVFDRLLTADILERLCEIIDFHQSDTAFSDIKLVFSSTYLGFKTAQKERIRNLNALASRFEVNLYTDRTDDRLRGVHVKESVDYREEMPLVFSRIRHKYEFYNPQYPNGTAAADMGYFRGRRISADQLSD